MEREGEATEKRLGSLDDGYRDLAKGAEDSGKRQQGALAKTAKAIGGVRDETRQLARETEASAKSAGAVSDAFKGAADRSVSDLQRVRQAMRAIGDEEGAFEIGVAIDQAKKREAQAEIAAFKAGLDDETVNVHVDYDRSQIQGVAAGFRDAASQIRAFQVLTGTIAIPGLISAVAGAIPLVTALAGRTVQLGSALGAGLAGGAAIGGTAVAGLVGGLKAYGAVIGSSLSASREVYLAENQAQAERLESARIAALTTRETNALNRELSENQIRWYRLQGAVASAVAPHVAEELDSWDEQFGMMEDDIVATSGAMAAMGAAYVDWFQKLRGGTTSMRIFEFFNHSALRGVTLLGELGQVGVRVFSALINPATRLQLQIVHGVAAFDDFIRRAKATGQLAAAIGFLQRRMYQVFAITGNLVRGFVNVGRAVNAAVNMENVLNPLVYATRGFSNFVAAGNRGATAITGFMNRAEPALAAFRGLVFEAVRQVLILANALVSAGQSGGRIGTLATVINSVRASLMPIRLLLQQTFIQLAPALARLIPAVVEFAAAFLGSSNVLVSFVNRITGLLNFFNRMPPSIQGIVIEAVALNSIMSLMGGPTIAGLIGGLMRTITAWGTYRAATSAATAANVAAGTSTTALTLRQRAAAVATGAWTAATRIAAVTSRGLGVALRFMLGPWGLLISAIALGVTAIVMNWSKIRPALQPVINLFNQAKNAATTLGRIFAAAFSGNIARVRQLIMQLPGPLRGLGMTFARLGVAAKALVNGGIRLLQAGIARVAQFFRSNLPSMQRTGQSVFARLGQVVRSFAGPVIAFLRRGVQQMAAWWRQNLPLMQRTAQTVFRAIAAVIRSAITGAQRVIQVALKIIGAVWRATHTQLGSIVRSVWTIIKTTISAGVRIVGQLVRAGMMALNGDWKGAWQSIQNATKIASQAVQTILRALMNIAKQVIVAGWNLVKTAWNGAMTLLGNATQGMRDRVGNIVQDLKAGLEGAWQSIKSAASSAWEAISGAIWRPIETAYTKVTEFLDKILGAVNKVLGWVGIDPIGEGSSGSKANARVAPTGSNRTPNRSKPVRSFAEGGRVDPVPGGVYRVAEAGEPEWVVNPNSRGYLDHLRGAAAERGYRVVRGPGAPPHRTGRYGRNPGVSTAVRRGLAPPWHAGGGEGVGPTMHTYIPEMRDFVDAANAEFDVYTNTYSNHPPGYEQPYYRERSTDFWGPGGRGADLSTAMHEKTVPWTIDRLSGDLNWLISNGRMLTSSGWGPDTSGFDHYSHQHTTAFASGPTASGEGSGGGLMAALFERGWNRFVQPVVDGLLKPLTNGPNVFARFAGAAAQKVPEGIKEWALSKLGGLGGGSGLSGTPAQNRALGEKMFPDSGLPGQFSDVDAIWTQESGWDHKAQNPTSSAFGIPQFLDSTWEQYGGKSFDAEGQIKKGYAYIGDRYGSTGEALAFKQANGWYGRGGMAIGPQLMGLAEKNRQELVLPLGDRRVQTSVQSLFQIGQMRDELAAVRSLLAGGIRVDSYGQHAEEVIKEGYNRAPRAYLRSLEGRTDIGTQQDRRAELNRISGVPNLAGAGV